MWERIKDLGWGILGIASLIIIVLLVGLFIHGGAWLSSKVYPIVTVIFGITFVIALIILTPISIFKKARGFAGKGIVISSYIFGFTLWVWSFLLTYALWGGLGIFIGLFLFGVGIVPIAMLATAFKGLWAIFGQLILLTILTFGSRFFGVFLIESYESSKAEHDYAYEVQNYEATDKDLHPINCEDMNAEQLELPDEDANGDDFEIIDWVDILDNTDVTNAIMKERETGILKTEEVKKLIAIGLGKGFLTYDDINEILPRDVVFSNQIDEILELFHKLDIDVLECN